MLEPVSSESLIQGVESHEWLVGGYDTRSLVAHNILPTVHNLSNFKLLVGGVKPRLGYPTQCLVWGVIVSDLDMCLYS